MSHFSVLVITSEQPTDQLLSDLPGEAWITVVDCHI